MRGFTRWMMPPVLAIVLVGSGLGQEATMHGPMEGLPPPGEPWDLVYMTDSTGWGVAEFYAEQAEEALGVEVRLHDLRQGGLSARWIEYLLEAPQHAERYAERVAEAEIIVVFGNPRLLDMGLPQPDIETCVSVSPEVRPPPAPSDADDWAPYRASLGRVFERIWDLREGKPTVFRAVDMYAPALGPWEAAGILPECTREWTTFSEQIRAAAEAHGVRMVSIYDALNGPEHDRDLVELGWICVDGAHPSVAGSARAAEALAAAGFEPMPPPRDR